MQNTSKVWLNRSAHCCISEIKTQTQREKKGKAMFSGTVCHVMYHIIFRESLHVTNLYTPANNSHESDLS